MYNTFPHILVSYSDHVFTDRGKKIQVSFLYFFFLRQIPLCIQDWETGARTHFVFETGLCTKAPAHHRPDLTKQKESPTQLS